jgi:hypothetical protein
MNIWFIRTGGDTPLNNPYSPDFVPGEPPTYPKTAYDYREKSLEEGFARIGWPNTGDLREENPTRLAPDGYSFQTIEPLHRNFLRKFRSIKAGDLILIPSIEETYTAYLGIALTINRLRVPPYINPRPDAYYHYYNLDKGDWYECAHRVNVLWAKDSNDEFAIYQFHELETINWRYAFSEVKNDKTIYQTAQKAKLF